MYCISMRHHMLSKTWFKTDVLSFYKLCGIHWEDDINNPNVEKFISFNDALFKLNIIANNPSNFQDVGQLYMYVMDDSNNSEVLIYDRGTCVYNSSTKPISIQNTNSSIDYSKLPPGEALKKYRNGEDVDWVELAKKYGGG